MKAAEEMCSRKNIFVRKPRENETLEVNETVA